MEVVEYCVMAELAEQVDLRTFASARDFSTAHLVIWAEQRVRVFNIHILESLHLKNANLIICHWLLAASQP